MVLEALSSRARFICTTVVQIGVAVTHVGIRFKFRFGLFTYVQLCYKLGLVTPTALVALQRRRIPDWYVEASW